jgi:hypothetical protein
MNESTWKAGGVILTGKTEILGRKPVPSPPVHKKTNID